MIEQGAFRVHLEGLRASLSRRAILLAGSASAASAPTTFKFQVGPNQGGSDLDKFMAAHARSSINPAKDWRGWLINVRVVAQGLAKGLDQLHRSDGVGKPFIHNDVSFSC